MENLRGAALVVGAMVFFTFEDILLKGLAGRLSIGLVVALVGMGGTTIFALAALSRGAALFGPGVWHRGVVLRSIGEMIGAICFVSALALTPLSSATAILQAAPLAVTLGAAVIFRTKVGWRRWSASLIGFAGVLMILRPGMEAFQPASLLAVVAVLGLALRDLATRMVPPHVHTLTVSAWGYAATIPAGLALWLFERPSPLPTGPDWALLAGTAVVGSVGYYMIVAGTRIGELVVVMPFRYTRLAFAMTAGAIVFHERPDAMTLAGAAVVVGSGLFVLAREAQIERKRRASVLSRPEM